MFMYNYFGELDNKSSIKQTISEFSNEVYFFCLGKTKHRIGRAYVIMILKRLKDTLMNFGLFVLLG